MRCYEDEDAPPPHQARMVQARRTSVGSRRASSDFQNARGDEPRGGADHDADEDVRHAIK